MSEKNERKFVITFNSEKEEQLKNLLDRVYGKDVNPIQDWKSMSDQKKEDDLVLNLVKNKEFRLLIEAGLNSKQDQVPVSEKVVNENNLKLLKSLEIIDYEIIGEEINPQNKTIENSKQEKPGEEKQDQEKQNEEKAEQEKDNPNPEKLHDEIENPEENKKEDGIDDKENKLDELNDAEKKPEGNVEGQERDSKDENSQEKPKSADDVEQKVEEKIEEEKKSPEYLFLTKERLLKQVDNLPFPEEIKRPIRDAYNKAVYVSQLENPDYLKNFLTNDEEAKKHGVETESFGRVHKDILKNTYVGYEFDPSMYQDAHKQVIAGAYVEDNIEKNSIKTSDQSNIGMIEYPQMVENMPQWVKSMINDKLAYYIKTSIDRIIDGSNSYDALVLITPIDRVLDEGIDRAANSNESMFKGDLEKAYIRYIASDTKNNLKREFATGTQLVGASLKAYDIDWTNPRVRRDMIEMLSRNKESADFRNIESIISSVQMNVVINNKDDVDKLKEMCNDFKGLKISKDVAVVVNVDDPKEKAEISREVDSVISGDSEIYRDHVEETKMMADRMFGNAVLMATAASVGMVMANEMEDEKGASESELMKNDLEYSEEDIEYAKQNSIYELAMMANLSFEEAQALLEEAIEENENALDSLTRQFYDENNEEDSNNEF